MGPTETSLLKSEGKKGVGGWGVDLNLKGCREKSRGSEKALAHPTPTPDAPADYFCTSTN